MSENEAAVQNINAIAAKITKNLLPEKSSERYNIAYKEFLKWQKSENIKTISEEVLIVYFNGLAKKFKSSTLWSTFSMLKSTLQVNNDINISSYHKLITYLKRQSKDYKCKKAMVLSPQDVEKFLQTAPDIDYLGAKIILIFGICGACRGIELVNIKTDDVEENNKLFIVKIPLTKNYKPRSFVIDEKFYGFVKKYMDLKPKDVNINRFFLNYQHGKCTKQPVGKNKIAGIPKEIARFLGLNNPDSYTGHCFRRTSATLLADAGANITLIKRHGGWRSEGVAEGYIEESINNKKRIGHLLTSAVKVQSTQAEKLESSEDNTSIYQVPSTSSTSSVNNLIIDEAKIQKQTTPFSIVINNSTNCSITFN
ncbi:tyrosine recombinase XerC-like [Prorops nasuta]|uniref:tyrosine recombinase XerC-like n=1 Tax=Prorops nasuta TaxID=863751 RepID=UPI0034CD3BB5